MELGLLPTKDFVFNKTQKIFFGLFVLLFLVAPFYYQPNFGGDGLYLPFNSSVWGVACWVVVIASLISFREGTVVLPRYWFSLLLIPLNALVIGVIAENNNPTEWLVRVSAIVGGYLFLLSLFQYSLRSRHIDIILCVFVVMGGIAATYGFVQIYPGFHIEGIVPYSENYLPTGIFQHVNVQASLMSTVLVLIYYLLSRPALANTSLVVGAGLCIVALLASYTVAISGSRVGLLGAALGLILLFLGRWKLFKFRRKTVIAVIACTVIGIMLGNEGIERSSAKLDRAMGSMDHDIRWKVYSLSWELFKEAPLAGHGLGSFEKVFQEKRAEYQVSGKLSLGQAPKFTHPHNELIFWMVEGGLLAILGILIATLFTIVQLIKLGWQRGLGYAALLLPIALHTQVELPFYISATHWLVILVLVFLVHQHVGKVEIAITSISSAARIAIPACFLVFSLLCTSFLVQTQVAYAGIFRYLYGQEKDPKFLQLGQNNFYFQEYTTYLVLRREMLIGLRIGNQKPVEAFAIWAEEHIKTSPDVYVYKDLAFAYNAMGNTALRDRTMRKALSIYEQNKALVDLKKQFKDYDSENG